MEPMTPGPGLGLVSRIQTASHVLPISNSPNWHITQLIIVAIVAGKTSLPVLLNALKARPERA